TPHEDAERPGARHAHARHAHRRGDGRARSRARAGVRSPVPRRHDPAPPGGDRHGGRAVQVVRRGAGRNRVQVRQRRAGRSIGRNQRHEGHAPAGRQMRKAQEMSRITGTLVAGTLAMIIAACGSSSTTSKPPATKPAAPAQPAATPAQPSPPSQPATPPATPPAAQPPAAQPPAQPGAGGGQPGAGAGSPAGAPGGRGTPPPPPPTPPSVMPKPVTPIVSGAAPSPDPRVGLKAGWWDAGQAAWNMNMVSTTPPTGKSLGATHSDLAFSGKYTIQGQYNGFDIYDMSNPEKPTLAQQYNCPASQNDVSVYRNLLFMSAEATNSRADCGFGGVPDPVSKDRVRGIRIFDISDVKTPKLVTSVQTCRGSH